ncbi:acyl-CoA dehydrogenase family protein [Arthrobacter sp. ISL-28]|uniref:acyl-CoA dehydrogenase family protein n=1 Tax=Arthrobacter sp. ISL-28 TaxID=2819108 RepID=UPI001BEC3EC7|nr:acyl-CoA dehydrogenase family protein [Arthrobacter sp. ISL-28]MBT2522571.1 acyl-CoA dehydrogenase family protein [Arthrobacter sp. ISL-28]
MTEVLATAPLATLDHVLEVIAERRQEFGEQKFVPREIISEFKKAGIYRSATPKRFGGDGLPPSEFLRIIEQISVVDASAGWVASFGSANVYLAALPLDSQSELYAAGPDIAFAGGLFPVQKAERVSGGWNVAGEWKFSSGCKGADVLGVGLVGNEESQGKPLTAVLRPEDVEIAENWDVIGLKGTGSHDLRVHGKFVKDEWTFVRGGQPTVDEPLYRYPTVAYAAQVLAVVNLGAGRAALDYAIQTGSGSTGITGAPKLADRPYYRVDVAKAEAELRSARAFFYEISDEVYATVEAGDAATDKQKALLRLASTHVAKVGAKAVQTAYTLSGTAAIYDTNPMQRYLRDASVVTQHAFLGDAIYDGAGAVLMDVPPAIPAFL